MTACEQDVSEHDDIRLASTRKRHVGPRRDISGNVGVPVWKPVTEWSVIVLMFAAVLFAWVAVLDGRGNDLLNRLTDRLGLLVGLRQVNAPPQREVLFVSSSQRHQLSVMTTLQPRGYIVHFAEDAAQALEQLQVHRDRIAVVLIDTGLPNATTVLSTAKTSSPGVRIVPVRGSDQQGHLPTQLMNSDALDGLTVN